MSGVAELPQNLVAQFRATSLERIQRIEAAWFALTQRVGTQESEAELFHDVHTLKGEARLVGFADVVLITQRFEDLLFAARRRRYRVHEDVDVVVTMAIQFIRMLLRKRAGASQGGIDLNGFLKHMDDVLTEWPRHSESPETTSATPSRVADASKLSSAVRQRLGIAATNVFIESLTGSRPRLSQAWEILSHELAQLDSIALMPLVRRHAVSAKDLAVELGKEVDVVIDGPTETRVNVEVLDTIHSALLHTLRNAMDHGIERPDDRTANGKPRRGTVTVRIRDKSDAVTVVVEDDGAGADVERIRRRATKLGLLTTEAAAAATDTELIALVFAPGFSVRETADEISGRGIGMDAVRATIERLRGTIDIRSTPKVGVTVEMWLPQNSKVIDVHRLPSTREGLVIAIPTTWTLRKCETTVDAIDPLKKLGIETSNGSIHSVLTLSRERDEISIVVGGAPTRGAAVRICPTPPNEPVEVVQMGSELVLLMRPECLFTSGSSAVPAR